MSTNVILKVDYHLMGLDVLLTTAMHDHHVIDIIKISFSPDPIKGSPIKSIKMKMEP